MPRVAVLVVLAVACGPREAAPTVDFGPPPAPIAPIVCPEVTLERFAARLGAPLTIELVPLVDATRVDKIPCKPAETDVACKARARQRSVPGGFEVAGISVGGEIADVAYRYQLDGRILEDRAPSFEAMIARLKALQAAGHRVTVIEAITTPVAESRHAAIVYRVVGGRQRRVATLRWRPDRPLAEALAEAQDTAARERIEIVSWRHEDGELVMTATCGAGPGDVRSGI